MVTPPENLPEWIQREADEIISAKKRQWLEVMVARTAFVTVLAVCWLLALVALVA